MITPSPPPKKTKNLDVLHKTQVICSSDHRAAKIFVKDSVFVKMQAYSFSKEQRSVEKLFLQGTYQRLL